MPTKYQYLRKPPGRTIFQPAHEGASVGRACSTCPGQPEGGPTTGERLWSRYALGYSASGINFSGTEYRRIQEQGQRHLSPLSQREGAGGEGGQRKRSKERRGSAEGRTACALCPDALTHSPGLFPLPAGEGRGACGGSKTTEPLKRFSLVPNGSRFSRVSWLCGTRFWPFGHLAVVVLQHLHRPRKNLGQR